MLGLNCIQAYPFTTILLETPRAIANFVFGVVFEPYFDHLFMATSLVEFGARRWNLLVSNMPHDNLVFCLLKARLGKQNSWYVQIRHSFNNL
jgi:hypothetical protein